MDFMTFASSVVDYEFLKGRPLQLFFFIIIFNAFKLVGYEKVTHLLGLLEKN